MIPRANQYADHGSTVQCQRESRHQESVRPLGQNVVREAQDPQQVDFVCLSPLIRVLETCSDATPPFQWTDLHPPDGVHHQADALRLLYPSLDHYLEC